MNPKFLNINPNQKLNPEILKINKKIKPINFEHNPQPRQPKIKTKSNTRQISISKQNNNRSKFQGKKKNQMNKNKRLIKQNFLTNLQEHLSANSKKPRIPQIVLFFSTPNQASQYLKSLVNFQQRMRGFFFRNFQLSKKFVFCLRITRRFKVFLLLQ